MFHWQDKFSCGIKEIDRQHQKLFEIGTKVYDLAVLKDDFDHYDEMTQAIEELIDYTEYHFGYEEALFKKYQYEDAFTHKVEHDFFVKKIKRIGNKDLDENQDQTLMEIVTFVADWISGHILDTDMKYKECFIKGGV